MPNQENIALLQRLISIIETLSDQQFIHTDPAIFISSIGSHVRHVLDHYRIFLDGLEQGDINYDNRAREQLIEFNRSEALQCCNGLIHALESVTDCQRVVNVTLDLSCGDSTVATEPEVQVSTVGRELTFLHSHTVHHQAVIGFIMRLLKITPVPDDFGLAPATIRYKESRQCAR